MKVNLNGLRKKIGEIITKNFNKGRGAACGWVGIFMDNYLKERFEGDCKDCGAIEPCFWDYEKDGLWSCGCHSSIKTVGDERKKKALDAALRSIREKFGNDVCSYGINTNTFCKRANE